MSMFDFGKVGKIKFDGPTSGKEGGSMLARLGEARDVVNETFDVLEVIVIRLGLLGLAALGVYALLSGHPF
jgi:hypothetical protein